MGASNFGVDSVLITSGIHKDLFKNGIEKGIKNIENDRKWNFKPTYVCVFLFNLLTNNQLHLLTPFIMSMKCELTGKSFKQATTSVMPKTELKEDFYLICKNYFHK